jgi:hypothetical protein
VTLTAPTDSLTSVLLEGSGDRLPVGTTDYVVERMFPTPSPYASDPVGWVGNKLGEHLWSKQREIAESVVNNRYTAVHSAHETGKSHIASRLVSWWIDTHPVGEAFAVTTAPTTTQVEAILWREISSARSKGDLPGRTTLDAKWYIGAQGNEQLVAYGRKPQDKVKPEEAMQAFQGIHAKYVLIVIDEACGIAKWLFDAVDTLAANEYARVLAIGNPDDPASHFATEVCKPGSGWNTIHIDGLDSPNFTDEEIPDDLRYLLLSQHGLTNVRPDGERKIPLYVAKVRGLFPEISDDTLISPTQINTARYKTDLSGPAVKTPGIYGCDIARSGSDETCMYRNRNGYVRLAYFRHRQTTMKTAGAIAAKIKAHPLNVVAAIVDVIGIGAGVYDRLKELNLPVHPFNASEKSREPDRYLNKRAEGYWHMRSLFEEENIDIDPDDDELAAQLVGIKWWYNSSGKIVIEPKEDIKKRDFHRLTERTQ